MLDDEDESYLCKMFPKERLVSNESASNACRSLRTVQAKTLLMCLVEDRVVEPHGTRLFCDCSAVFMMY